jgi:hypothetical protein
MLNFNKRNNLEDLRRRTCTEINGTNSPDIIQRSVQSVSECQMVDEGQFQYLH